MITTSRLWKCLALLSLAMLSGCAGRELADPRSSLNSDLIHDTPVADATSIQPVSFEVKTEKSEGTAHASLDEPVSADELPPPADLGASGGRLQLSDVLISTYASYPLLESALYSRDIALGNYTSAKGEFDLKLKGTSANGALGFYQTYRQSIGLTQPLYSGGEIWGGYRIGRGDFQPWYLERQTNDSGEFRTGLSVPLLRNRSIDERRAELWRSGLERNLAEFDIQSQLIGFIQQASYAYWDWVAAGRGLQIAERILDLAESRNERIKEQVEAGLIDPPELTDNERLVALRRAILANQRRILEQKASKLSLYLRDLHGAPIVPDRDRLPDFPAPQSIDPTQFASDLKTALANRPDLQILDTVRRQLHVDLAQAYNEMQPDMSAVVWGSQDLGAPSSAKRDKTPFELEAGFFVDVPVQRRKARGKITAIEAKLQQIVAKRRMTEDKISVDLQTAYAALKAAFEQVQETREAIRLAEDLAQRERLNFEAGLSDLLKVTLREQFAAESAVKEMESLLKYYLAEADYRAAIAANLNQ